MIGTVMQQVFQGQVQLLTFYSRRTTGPERRYSMYDLKLQFIYSVIVNFQGMLEG